MAVGVLVVRFGIKRRAEQLALCIRFDRPDDALSGRQDATRARRPSVTGTSKMVATPKCPGEGGFLDILKYLPFHNENTLI